MFQMLPDIQFVNKKPPPPKKKIIYTTELLSYSCFYTSKYKIDEMLFIACF